MDGFANSSTTCRVGVSPHSVLREGSRRRAAGEGRAEGCLVTVGTVFSRERDVQLLITSDHYFVFLSILTIFMPDLSEFRGQN
jgi:hypothetical protein